MQSLCHMWAYLVYFEGLSCLLCLSPWLCFWCFTYAYYLHATLCSQPICMFPMRMTLIMSLVYTTLVHAIVMCMACACDTCLHGPLLLCSFHMWSLYMTYVGLCAAASTFYLALYQDASPIVLFAALPPSTIFVGNYLYIICSLIIYHKIMLCFQNYLYKK